MRRKEKEIREAEERGREKDREYIFLMEEERKIQ